MSQSREYSIILPLMEVNGETHVVFEVRSKLMRRQPGEVCFPGGKIDNSDQGPEDAGERELYEELGVSNQQIEDIFLLGLFVSPFGMKANVFVGMIQPVDAFSINPDEVEEVFTVPLQFFIDYEPKIHYINIDMKPEENFPYDDLVNGDDYKWQTLQYEENFYYYQGQVIWGLTAKILKEFITLIKKT
nr:CoA pyrophosphatase [Alkalibacillus aidingensis]